MKTAQRAMGCGPTGDGRIWRRLRDGAGGESRPRRPAGAAPRTSEGAHRLAVSSKVYHALTVQPSPSPGRHLPQEKRKQTFISKPALGRSQRLRLQKPKTVEMTQMSISRMGSAPGRGKHMRGGLCSFQHPFPDPTATEHPRRSRLWAEGRRYTAVSKRGTHPIPAPVRRTSRQKEAERRVTRT